MDDLKSQPTNIGQDKPFQEHFDLMIRELNTAINEAVLAARATQEAVDRWNREHPETPAQPGDLVIPDHKKQLPATLVQSKLQENSLATEGSLKQGEDKLPAHSGESMNTDMPNEPAIGLTDLLPKPTGLQSGFLGKKIKDTKEAMTNPNSPYYAKRANINTPRGTERKQNDLAETIYANKNPDANKRSNRSTTFEKKGYTAEQANRNTVVTKITATSQETAKGIGTPEELQKSKPHAWDGNDVP